MRKMFYGMLALLVGCTVSVTAQVTIGSEAPPTPGAVLDLQSGGKQGLLMPQITLTSAYLWAPLDGVSVDGMIVFNTATTPTNGLEGTGVYVWINGKWRLLYHSNPCEGAIIYNGAYSGPGPGVYSDARFDGSFSAGWTNEAFSALSKDLCWNKQDVSDSKVEWADAVSSCTGDWRLPNLKELQVLYDIMDGRGMNVYYSDFGNLQSPHSNPGGATNLDAISGYWSSTEWAIGGAYYFYFTGGKRVMVVKSVARFARCVRTL